MIFPLEAGEGRTGLTKEKYPKTIAYLESLYERDAYKRAVERIEKETGETFSNTI